MGGDSAISRSDGDGATPPSIPNFDLLRRIGSGGFGTVWLARERLTGLRRAIKVIPKTADGRAEREIAGVHTYQNSSLNHPHLMQILHVGENTGEYFYIMEAADCVPGCNADDYQARTLAAALRESGPLEPATALDWIGQIAQGVKQLHSRNLRHCDLKPVNVFWIEGRLKIGDVGLVENSANPGRGLGTPGYMSPEGVPDDLYALGKLLYVMATGLAAADYPNLQRRDIERRPGSSGRIIRLINRTCARRPEARPQSIDEFLTQVQSARDKSPEEIRKRWRLVIGLTVATASLSVGSIWYAQRPVAEIHYRLKDGSFYTHFRVWDVDISSRQTAPGSVVHVRFRYQLMGAAGHRLWGGLAFNDNEKSLATFYDGSPGRKGEFGSAEVMLRAPLKKGDYDLRAFVSHVLERNDLRDGINPDDRAKQPEWTSIGIVRVE